MSGFSAKKSEVAYRRNEKDATSHVDSVVEAPENQPSSVKGK